MIGLAIGCATCVLAASVGQNVCDPVPAGDLVSPLLNDLSYAGDAVALSGTTAVVGAPYAQSFGAPSASGGAFVYRLEGGDWVQEAFLSVPTARAGDRAGFAVELEGNTAVISSPYRSTFDGEVFVYVRRQTPGGPVWEPQANIKPPEPGSLFGHDVALQGDTLAIGQPYNDVATEGCVQIYWRIGGQWVHAGRVRAQGALPGDLIGTSLAMRGRWLVMGAPFEVRFPTFGSAYVFERTDAGWVQRARLVPDGAFFGDQAGHDVAVDEPYLAISSTQAYGAHGRVWIFRNDGVAWVQEAILAPPTPPRPSSIRLFGSGIALRGGRLAVGAPWWDRDGGIFGYERAVEGWILAAVVGNAELSSQGVDVIDMGRSVALDGELAVGGSPFTRVGKLFTGAAHAVRFPEQAFGLVVQPVDQPLGATGDGAAFEVVATGPGQTAYRWTREGVPLDDDERIAGARTPRLIIDSTLAQDAGEYRCVVTSQSCGERISEPAYLYFGPCVSVSGSSDGAMITPGAGTSFAVAAEGLEPIEYRWYRSGSALEDGGRISGSRSPVLTIDATQPQDAGGYTCVVTARCGSASSPVSTLSFHPCAAVVEQPSDTSAHERDLVTLRVGAGGVPGGPALTFQWMRNGVPVADDGRIRGAATPTLLIHPLSFDDSGHYTCLVSCGYTAELSDEALLVVTLRPCFGDANRDRSVDLVDVSAVLANFGATYGTEGGQGDADRNRTVNFADIASVLANFGDLCTN